MFAFLQDLQGATGARLLSVLLHSLWQGGLCALLAGLSLRRIPASRATLRYGLSLTALLTTVLACFLTWSFLGPAWNFSGVRSQSTVGTSGEQHRAVHEHESHGASAGADAGHPSSIDSTPSGSASSTSKPLRSKLWSAAVPLLLCGWLLGVVVMLSRVAASLHAARQLLRGTPVTDSALLELVDRVRRRIGMTRAIRVLMVPHLSTPVICGILSPALVVPAAFLTGISPDQQLAIVAHELAHIRRWDFLINLVQLVIESVLFFNPAVWWLSRQIRIEREACCDAIAVSLTDAPLEYVRTLASWAERMASPRTARAPALAPAFAEPSDGTHENSLVDRVRRVLSPTHTPHLRVRWGTLLGLLAFVAVTLILIARGTDWAVAQAAKVLTDAERIEVVAKARDEVKTESTADLRNGKFVTVRARVRTWDRKPVSAFNVSLSSQAPSSGYSLGTSIDPNGVLDVKIEGGQLRAAFMASGYAPVLFPERPAMGGTEVDFGEVVLPQGRPARVRFVDIEGRPVRADRVSTGPEKASSRPASDLRASDAGEVTFDNIIDEPYQVHARARGFQPIFRWQGPLPEHDVTTIVMKPAAPLTGTVTDEQGQPVAGVEIFASSEQITSDNSDGHYGYGNSFGFPGQLWETTSAEGRFRIDQMAEGARMGFVLKKDGVPRAMITDAKPGERDVVWKLDPAISLRGRVTGDLDLINKDPRYRSIFFSILRTTKTQPNDQVQTGNLKVEPDGQFEFTGLICGRLSIAQPYAKLERELTGPIDDLEIPLIAPMTGPPNATRPLTLVFAHAGKAVTPGGRVVVSSHSMSPARKPFPIRQGETAVEIPTTGAVEFDAAELLGFGIDRTTSSFRAEELGPTLVLQVVPAGVIRGTVLAADGQPAAGVAVSVGVASNKLIGLPSEVRTNADGQFLLNPIQLDGVASVTASLERVRILSEPVRLDTSRPEQSVTLRLPQIVSAEVQVFDDGGSPLANCPLGLEIVTRNAETSTSHGFGVGRTDAAGKVIVTGLGEPLSAYKLYASRKGPWLGRSYQFAPRGLTEIHLERGHTLGGTVLDDAGKPVPNVGVAASLRTEDHEPTLLYLFESELKTDENGKFRFSNLPDKLVRLSVPGMNLSNDQINTLHPPDGPPVTLQGTVPDWLRARRD